MKTYRWIEQLLIIIQQYNKTYHETIKQTPYEALLALKPPTGRLDTILKRMYQYISKLY